MKTEKEAKKIICELLGDHLTRLSITSYGRRLYADVYYKDYKPERVVRSEIEDAVPNLTVECIGRDFSPEHIVEAMYNDQTVIYVQSDGRLEATTPGAYISELMNNIDLNK